MNATGNDIFGDLDRLRLQAGPTARRPDAQAARPRHARECGGEFLKGPIPLAWLTAASKLPGRGPLAVALAVWFEAGRRKCDEARLTTAVLLRFNVGRKAKYAALRALEAAGLVAVRREPRKNPVVTILGIRGRREGEAARGA